MLRKPDKREYRLRQPLCSFSSSLARTFPLPTARQDGPLPRGNSIVRSPRRSGPHRDDPGPPSRQTPDSMLADSWLAVGSMQKSPATPAVVLDPRTKGSLSRESPPT
jgi:hypothetical protein